MPKDNHGFEWDPDGWKEERLARRREEEAAKRRPQETEYQKALCSWYLKQKMIKQFGFRPWMRGVVNPDELEWDENGNRVRKPGARILSEDHTIIPKPKPKRRLRH